MRFQRWKCRMRPFSGMGSSRKRRLAAFDDTWRRGILDKLRRAVIDDRGEGAGGKTVGYSAGRSILGENSRVWPARLSDSSTPASGAVYLLIDAIDAPPQRGCPAMPTSGWRCSRNCCRRSQNRDAFSDDAGRAVVAGRKF